MKCSVLVLVALQISVVFSAKLPSFLKICHRNDPNLRQCLKKSVEELRPLLTKGIPEFDIPSCEPLVIPEVVIDEGAGAVAVKSTYRNIKIYGPSKFIIKNVKLDLDKNRLRIKIFLPSLQMNSNYSMQGKILMMPISGSGLSRGNYSNIEATVTMQGQRIKKDNEVYFNITDFFVDFNIGHAAVQLDDLFNGDKELGEAMNLFLNDNWKSVASEIKPVLEDTIADIFKRFANKMFHKYPLDVLLPE